MPVAEDLRKLTFDELAASKGFRRRAELARACGISDTVLALYAAGWTGSVDSRAALKRALEVDDDTLNAVILCSCKAAMRRMPKD